MGFKKVYKALLEIFPEVDSRALRAVAIEHQKDADAAVEVVLTEVIPFLTERSAISSKTTEKRAIAQPPKENVAFANGPTSPCNSVLVDNVKFQEKPHVLFYDAEQQTFHDASDGLHELGLESRPDNSVNESDERSVAVGSGTDMAVCISSVVLVHENGASASPDKESGDNECKETPNKLSQESSTQSECDQVSQTLEHENVHPVRGLDLEADLKADFEAFFNQDLENENVNIMDVYASTLYHSDVKISDLNKEYDGQVETALNTEASSEMVNMEDDYAVNTLVTRSGQICSIDLLEDIISDARNNKKTLLSAVGIVLGLMKEVEAHEKAAEKAKDDAANGGLDILKRVEDLKKMLQHAKEANDMHAGEVYGEKAILATEVRELQSRLQLMSEERDRSLKIFDEMRLSLEERLAAAEEEIKAAEKEKLEREDVAWKSLKHQEVIMEKVVEEANLLKQEAEANAKLREFLMDRGRVVDTLQGEISVICTDMRLLKSRFDERLPLSKSLASSQMACILSSSSSSEMSVRSGRTDQVSNQADISDSGEKIPNTTDDKDLGDDGWEIFDNPDAYI